MANTKKILLNAGKTALTLAVPPLGFPTFFKKATDRAAAVIGGVFLSAGLSLGLQAVNKKIVYDAPKISVYKEVTGLYDVGAALVSPLGFMYATPGLTRLDLNQNSYVVRGSDVVTFDKKKREYVVNFPIDRDFGTSSLSLRSVQDAKDGVYGFTIRIEALTSGGDIFAARKVSAERDLVVKKYEDAYGAFTQTRGHYQAAVDRMNLELKSLNQKPRSR